MKDLDDVIRALEYCGNDGEQPRICSKCPYVGEGWCHAVLFADALAYLKRLDDLRKDVWDLANKNHDLTRKLRLVRIQRDQAWEKLAWLGEKPRLMDNGEYVPEAPKEGM